MKEFKHKNYISISTPLNSEDFKLFQSIVNVGIDAHLEAFIKSSFFVDCNRYYFHFHKSEKPILLRRLKQYLDSLPISTSDEEIEYIERWYEDIINYDKITANDYI